MDDVTTESPSKKESKNATKIDALLPTDRFKLKEKLQEMAERKKQQQSQPNKFVSLRSKLVAIVEGLVKKYGVPPTSMPLHETLFFNNSNLVANGLIGKHRSAITKALTDPGYFLECECCADTKDCLSPSLPDISIVYRLHLECGRLINLYDWLQAFCACVEKRHDRSIGGGSNAGENTHHDNSDDNQKHESPKNKLKERSRDEPNPELQARFVQAVSELQFLGFIKTSKRKTDHVARLTWGGC
ncbi:hypothetical protein FHG87_007809 [Trinorchestia longiramus]|nr:hypothetical protein FHG87_007809 [Trinorchestia longiramus]